jgi:hypothetical protein
MTEEQQTTKKHVFNYGEITADHKEAAEEIANFISGSGNEMLAELIKQRFKVTSIPRYDIKESKFANACVAAGVFPSVQGYLQEGDGLDKKEYPLIGITEDVRKLEKLYEAIKNSV